MREYLKILVAVIMILWTMPPFVSAIGIAPGHVDLNYKAGGEETVTIKIVNNDGLPMQVVLAASGELESNIIFAEQAIDLKEGEKERITTYKVRMPASLDKPGPHSTNIFATVRQVEDTSGTGMSASVAVISVLNVMVPYPGLYAEVSLYAPQFKLDTGGNFVVEVKNLGTQDLTESRVMLDIYAPNGTNVAPLISDIFNLPAGQSKQIAIKWTPEVEPGIYKAVATLIYAGGNAADTKDVQVGDMVVKIIDLKARAFHMGDVAVFDVFMQSLWIVKIPGVYLEAEVFDSQGKLYTDYKSYPIDLNPKEKQILQAYWDTRTATPGDYVLKITLIYSGKTTENSYKIRVSLDKIETQFTGEEISGIAQGGQQSPISWLIILTSLIILLIALNTYLLIKNMKKKK